MVRNYSINQVAEMFKIVDNIRKNLSVLSAVYSGDPRFSCERAKEELKTLIPKYKEKVPKEIQEIIGISPNTLERMVE